MQRLIWTILAAFVMAIVFGPIVIPWLKRMKFGQTIYDLGPASHKKKQGIPTMGGVIFAVPAIAASVALSYGNARFDFLLILLACAVGFGLIGFIDDLIKVKKKRSLGLTPKQKLAPQILISIAISYWAFTNPAIGSALIVPFTSIELQLGWWYIPVMTFVLVATVNSANLMDGVDGLLGGCAMIDFATMALICVSLASADGSMNLLNTAIFSGAMAGSLLGYLRFNSYPAGVIMGDIGSFFVGGALVGIALVTRYALLLPIVALPLLVTTLSDLIQFSYFKISHGKRVFRMAPLHHHFELGGMPETRIVTLYYTVTALLCLLALLGFVG